MAHNLTLGELLDFVEKHKITRTAIIYTQRIEDIYFEKHGWKTVDKEGYEYHCALKYNEKIDGEFNDKEQYPDLDVSKMKKYTQEQLEQCKDKYHTNWCPVKYPDDDNLYIDAHY